MASNGVWGLNPWRVALAVAPNGQNGGRWPGDKTGCRRSETVVVRKNWISMPQKGFLVFVHMAPGFTPHWTLALEVVTI
jgi:hypothetical protein